MATQAEEQAFSFETSYELHDELPMSRPTERSRLGLTEDELFVGFGVVGIFCLFWRYTIALGVVVLVMTTFTWVMRERSRARRRRLDAFREPLGRVSIRVTEAGYSQRGDDYCADSSWRHVIGGVEIDGYLLVQSRRVPRVYLPIDEMKRAGVYDRVKAIIDARNAERRAFIANARHPTDS